MELMWKLAYCKAVRKCTVVFSQNLVDRSRLHARQAFVLTFAGTPALHHLQLHPTHLHVSVKCAPPLDRSGGFG